MDKKLLTLKTFSEKDTAAFKNSSLISNINVNLDNHNNSFSHKNVKNTNKNSKSSKNKNLKKSKTIVVKNYIDSNEPESIPKRVSKFTTPKKVTFKAKFVEIVNIPSIKEYLNGGYSSKRDKSEENEEHDCSCKIY